MEGNRPIRLKVYEPDAPEDAFVAIITFENGDEVAHEVKSRADVDALRNDFKVPGEPVYGGRSFHALRD